jgi:hypothetical protein
VFVLQTNLQSSATNCGVCFNTCNPFPNAAPACGGGKCVLGICNADFADCNGIAADGCEVGGAEGGLELQLCINVFTILPFSVSGLLMLSTHSNHSSCASM